MLLGIADPFQPVENLLSALFLGGILDSLQEMFYGKGGASGNSVSGSENDVGVGAGDVQKSKNGELLLVAVDVTHNDVFAAIVDDT